MNFYSYEDGKQIFEAISLDINALKGAYIIRGDSTFANLPSVITPAMNGYVYNITDGFVTDNRFVEGAGRQCDPGTNVVVVDRSTYSDVTPAGSEDPSSEGWYELVDGKYKLSEDTTVDGSKTYYGKNEVVKYEVSGSFVDLEKLNADIKAISDMITGEYDPKTAYNSGDVVTYNGNLYQIGADYEPYTAVTPVGTENPSEEEWYERSGSEGAYVYTATIDTTVDGSKTYYKVSGWDAATKTQTTVVELIESAEPESLTEQQLNSILELFR